MTKAKKNKYSIKQLLLSVVLKRMLFYITLFYCFWCLLLFFFQGSMVFPTHIMHATPPYPELEGCRQIWIETDAGERVEGWFFPSNRPGLQPTVLFFHGNGELIDSCIATVKRYRKWGFNVLLPEYRGYGRSAGTPGQKEIAADMRRFYKWLAKQPEVDTQRIIYHGRSLGGGVACQLAKDFPPQALILRSTFTSIASLASRYFVPTFLVQHPFRSDRVVENLECPVFIAHGTEDTIIAVSHGRKLRDLAKHSTYYEVRAGHNDFPEYGEFWRKIEGFLLEAQVIRAR